MRPRNLLARLRSGDRTVQAVMLEGFLNRLGFGIVTFALPLYALQLGLSLTEIGIVVAAKAFVQPAVKPLMGMLIDRVGARRGYLIAVSFRFAGALVLPFASTMGALIAVRMLQGAASAAQDPAAITVIARRGDGTRLGRRFATTMSARDVGRVSAGLIGGLLIAATGSFLVLWIAVAVIAALPILVVWRWVHDVPDTPESTEAAAPAPDPGAAARVFRDRRLRLVAGLGLLAGTTAHMTNALFQVYASEVAGLSAAQIGLITSLSIGVLLAVGPPAGWIADRYGTGALSSARGVANAGSSLLYLFFPVFGGMLAGRLVDDTGKAAFRPTWGALVGGAARRAGPRGGRVAATLDAALSLGEAIGPLLAAVLWDTFGFAVFLGVRAALGIVTELLLGRRLRALEREERRGTAQPDRSSRPTDPDRTPGDRTLARPERHPCDSSEGKLMSRTTTGIDVRHVRTCPTVRNPDARCKCSPSYQAHVWSARVQKRIRKTFSTLAEAKAWRAEALVALRRGTMRAPTAATLRQVWAAWLTGAREGSIRNRSGDTYKPSVLRGYETSMRLRVLPELGGARLSEITRVGVQGLADRMLADDLDASTIRNTLMPLRAIYRRALARGEVALNPVAGVELPSVRGRRDRIASPAEAAALVEALPEDDRAVWATAFYAGLRLGELWALRDEDVDLEAGVIRVERSWDRRDGVIEPKSRAGRRAVPIVAALRLHLAARKLRRGHSKGLFFGRGSRPFDRDALVARARKAWKGAGREQSRRVRAARTAEGLTSCGVERRLGKRYGYW